MSPSEASEVLARCAADYVSRAEWSRPTGRADLVDEIADSFERRVVPTDAAASPVARAA